MLRINMSQQYAKIGLDIQDPAVQLRTTPPRMEIHTEAAKLEISSSSGQLLIDQTPCRASCGMVTSAEFSRGFAEEGKSKVSEATGLMSEEGDRLMCIESHENAIVNIAAEKNYSEQPDVEWQLINPPIIEYRPIPVHYNSIPGTVAIELNRGTVENNFEWGKVTVSMLQYNQLDIWVTGSMTDLKI